jgi:hypothetical protein
VSLLQLFIVLHGCLGSPRVATSALASTEGVARRKEVCDSAVEACMRTDVSLLPIVTTHRYYPSLLPIVGTEARRKDYCAEIFRRCQTPTSVADAA